MPPKPEKGKGRKEKEKLSRSNLDSSNTPPDPHTDPAPLLALDPAHPEEPAAVENKQVKEVLAKLTDLEQKMTASDLQFFEYMTKTEERVTKVEEIVEKRLSRLEDILLNVLWLHSRTKEQEAMEEKSTPETPAEGRGGGHETSSHSSTGGRAQAYPQHDRSRSPRRLTRCCFNCRRPGHYARECPLPFHRRSRAPDPMGGPSTEYDHPQPVDKYEASLLEEVSITRRDSSTQCELSLNPAM